MKAGSLQAKNLFFQGAHQRLLQQSIDCPSGRWKLKELEYILGSLCMVGRSDEAELLFSKQQSKLSPEQRIVSCFFLGIGFTRRSNYPKARHYFGINLRRLGSRLSANARFFIYQGLSFYRYSCGKWRLAMRDSELAFQAALRINFIYGRILSSDLKGHLLVQMGQPQRGLRHLRQAQDLALGMRNQAIAQAIEISIVTYQAQFGISPKTALEDLYRHSEKALAVQNTYSLSELLLELARQFMLRGDFSRASELLDRAARQIYSHQNRRQEVTLNIRYAYLSYLLGDSSRGLSYVQAGKRALDPVVDHALRLAVLGIELKLVNDLQMTARKRELERLLSSDSVVYGGAVNRQMLARQQLFPKSDIFHSAEDPLGEIRDQMESGGASEIILRSGYYSFLLESLKLPRGRSIIYLDLDRNSLTLFDRSGVTHGSGITPLIRAFLQEISHGPCTKEELILRVWRYPSYRPLHHDSVIYQAVAHLRKILGRHADWIQTTEEGYQFRSAVELIFPLSGGILPEVSSSQVAAIKEVALSATPFQAIAADLNHRQIQFLSLLKPQQFIDVHDYRKMFRVSEITASRDLSLLNQQGLVVRMGRARATRYALTERKSL